MRAAIKSWFLWHRKTQLEDYAGLLLAIDAEVPADTSAERVCHWWSAVRVRIDRSATEAVPAITDIARSLKPAQIEHIEQKYAKTEAEFRDEFMQPDPERRRAEAESGGSGELLERLRAVDAAAAERLSPADTKRIIRAMEVFETTGRPISSFHEDDRRRRENTQWKLFGLEYSTEALAVRINERVDAMVREGLEQEVRALKERGLSRDSQAGRALGYSEMLACLDGECSLDEAVEAIKLNTRRFAKRQRTWFRADSRIAWIAAEGKSPDAIAEEILECLRG